MVLTRSEKLSLTIAGFALLVSTFALFVSTMSVYFQFFRAKHVYGLGALSYSIDPKNDSHTVKSDAVVINYGTSQVLVDQIVLCLCSQPGLDGIPIAVWYLETILEKDELPKVLNPGEIYLVRLSCKISKTRILDYFNDGLGNDSTAYFGIEYKCLDYKGFYIHTVRNYYQVTFDQEMIPNHYTFKGSIMNVQTGRVTPTSSSFGAIGRMRGQVK